MAFCKNCGAQINDFYSVCPVCGTANPVDNPVAMQSVDMQQQQQFAQQGYPQQQQFAQPGYPQPQQFAQPGYPQPQQQYTRSGYPQPQQYGQAGYYGQTFSEDRKANAGEIILAALFPLIGLILYFSYKDKKPTAANTIRLVALIAWGVSFLLGLIAGLIGG